jgi:Putative Actinobacterial Holin-X, holin superfamily III
MSDTGRGTQPTSSAGTGDAPRDVHDRSASRNLDDQPVADLLRQLSDQTATLVRQEMELAKAELTVKGKRVGIGAGMFGGAGLLGAYAFGALTACVILVLATAIDAWLAALIVAVVYAAIAGVLALMGKNKVQEATPPVPEQTVDSVKEDVQWTKERAKAGRQ